MEKLIMTIDIDERMYDYTDNKITDLSNFLDQENKIQFLVDVINLIKDNNPSILEDTSLISDYEFQIIDNQIQLIINPIKDVQQLKEELLKIQCFYIGDINGLNYEISNLKNEVLSWDKSQYYWKFNDVGIYINIYEL